MMPSENKKYSDIIINVFKILNSRIHLILLQLHEALENNNLNLITKIFNYYAQIILFYKEHRSLLKDSLEEIPKLQDSDYNQKFKSKFFNLIAPLLKKKENSPDNENGSDSDTVNSVLNSLSKIILQSKDPDYMQKFIQDKYSLIEDLLKGPKPIPMDYINDLIGDQEKLTEITSSSHINFAVSDCIDNFYDWQELLLLVSEFIQENDHYWDIFIKCIKTIENNSSDNQYKNKTESLLSAAQETRVICLDLLDSWEPLPRKLNAKYLRISNNSVLPYPNELEKYSFKSISNDSKALHNSRLESSADRDKADINFIEVFYKTAVNIKYFADSAKNKKQMQYIRRYNIKSSVTENNSTKITAVDLKSKERFAFEGLTEKNTQIISNIKKIGIKEIDLRTDLRRKIQSDYVDFLKLAVKHLPLYYKNLFNFFIQKLQKENRENLYKLQEIQAAFEIKNEDILFDILSKKAKELRKSNNTDKKRDEIKLFNFYAAESGNKTEHSHGKDRNILSEFFFIENHIMQILMFMKTCFMYDKISEFIEKQMTDNKKLCNKIQFTKKTTPFKNLSYKNPKEIFNRLLQIFKRKDSSNDEKTDSNKNKNYKKIKEVLKLLLQTLRSKDFSIDQKLEIIHDKHLKIALEIIVSILENSIPHKKNDADKKSYNVGEMEKLKMSENYTYELISALESFRADLRKIYTAADENANANNKNLKNSLETLISNLEKKYSSENEKIIKIANSAASLNNIHIIFDKITKKNDKSYDDLAPAEIYSGLSDTDRGKGLSEEKKIKNIIKSVCELINIYNEIDEPSYSKYSDSDNVKLSVIRDSADAVRKILTNLDCLYSANDSSTVNISNKDAKKKKNRYLNFNKHDEFYYAVNESFFLTASNLYFVFTIMFLPFVNTFFKQFWNSESVVKFIEPFSISLISAIFFLILLIVFIALQLYIKRKRFLSKRIMYYFLASSYLYIIFFNFEPTNIKHTVLVFQNEINWDYSALLIPFLFFSLLLCINNDYKEKHSYHHNYGIIFSLCLLGLSIVLNKLGYTYFYFYLFIFILILLFVHLINSWKKINKSSHLFALQHFGLPYLFAAVTIYSFSANLFPNSWSWAFKFSEGIHLLTIAVFSTLISYFVVKSKIKLQNISYSKVKTVQILSILILECFVVNIFLNAFSGDMMEERANYQLSEYLSISTFSALDEDKKNALLSIDIFNDMFEVYNISSKIDTKNDSLRLINKCIDRKNLDSLSYFKQKSFSKNISKEHDNDSDRILSNIKIINHNLPDSFSMDIDVKKFTTQASDPDSVFWGIFSEKEVFKLDSLNIRFVVFPGVVLYMTFTSLLIGLMLTYIIIQGKSIINK